MRHASIPPRADFNPRTYTRCDAVVHSCRVQRAYFNPRTYTRCDPTQRLPDLTAYISIHAPTRGAIHVPLLFHVCEYISIHAPTRGAIVDEIFKRVPVSFQSTHLHEVRLFQDSRFLHSTVFQSTHLHEVRSRDPSVRKS